MTLTPHTPHPAWIFHQTSTENETNSSYRWSMLSNLKFMTKFSWKWILHDWVMAGGGLVNAHAEAKMKNFSGIRLTLMAANIGMVWQRNELEVCTIHNYNWNSSSVWWTWMDDCVSCRGLRASCSFICDAPPSRQREQRNSMNDCRKTFLSDNLFSFIFLLLRNKLLT